MKADADFRSARQKGDLNKLLLSAKELGASAFHISNVISIAVDNNFPDQARELDMVLLDKYPRDIYGWRIRYALINSSIDEKKEAVKMIQELDPFNPNNPKN